MTDGLGNVRQLTDGSGNIRRSYTYGEWGQLVSGSDYLPFGGVDRVRWKGALWMGPELDLYYMRNRWYEPKTGRFLTEDPSGLAAGINLYTFAAGDPVGGSDPFGLDFCLPGDDGYWEGASVSIDGKLIGTTYHWHECQHSGAGPGHGGQGGGGPSKGTGGFTPSDATNQRNAPRGTPAAVQAIQCVGSSLAFGANVVESAITIRATARVAVGAARVVAGPVLAASIWGAIGVGVDASLGTGGGVALARVGARALNPLTREAMALKGVVTGGDVIGGNFEWANSLVPIVGLPSAWRAVDRNCR